MAARAFSVGSDGDLEISGGRIVLTSGRESIAQHARQRLRLFLGEWFLDQGKGFPYRERVFVKNPNIPLIKALVRRELESVPGILSVVSVSISVDSRSRSATCSYVAVADDGQLDEQFTV